MRVDPFRLEPGLLGQPAQDEEDPGASQASALGVEEEFRPVAAVEVGAPAREVAPQRIGRRPAQGTIRSFELLAGRSDEPLLEIDVGLAEADRLADP